MVPYHQCLGVFWDDLSLILRDARISSSKGFHYQSLGDGPCLIFLLRVRSWNDRSTYLVDRDLDNPNDQQNTYFSLSRSDSKRERLVGCASPAWQNCPDSAPTGRQRSAILTGRKSQKPAQHAHQPKPANNHQTECSHICQRATRGRHR